MSDASMVSRIWSLDPSVWGGSVDTVELTDRLGWLELPGTDSESISEVADLAEDVRAEYESIVLCGMGGSSLAADVFWRVVGGRSGYPALTVLDSTVPAAVRAVPSGPATLFVVSSKSGTTIETTSMLAHFWDATGARGSSFVAITDPGSELHELGQRRGFRSVVDGIPAIGGRFSALSPFGLVPAALIGVDVGAVLVGARSAAAACRRSQLAENPGAWLGAVIGEAALAGRNKLTLILSPSFASFGLWVEQLVAESTGKAGQGVVPVIDHGACHPDSYGDDRLFVSLSLRDEIDRTVEERREAFAQRGHPTVHLTLQSPEDVGGEMFRWEFATAVAGAILGVNPFDQPNVGESKTNTGRVLRETAAAASIGVASDDQVAALLAGVQPGEYLAILAYVAPTADSDDTLSGIARKLQERLRVPVTVGYGPRYLHSTGQLHKGGPASGHFIQVVNLPGADLTIPDSDFSFGDLVRAQAAGDWQALRSRGRPIVRLASVDQLQALVDTPI